MSTAVIRHVVLLAVFLLSACDDDPQKPLVWHYIGPSNRAEITQQAVEQMFRDCGRLTVYFSHLSKPEVEWVDSRTGRFENFIRVKTKVADDFDPPLAAGLVHHGNEVTLMMVGGNNPGYILSGTPAFWFCYADPPIGPKPVAIKPQNASARSADRQAERRRDGPSSTNLL